MHKSKGCRKEKIIPPLFKHHVLDEPDPIPLRRFLYRSASKIQAMVRGYLGRNRFQQKRLESDEEARIEMESFKVIKIQASLETRESRQGDATIVFRPSITLFQL